MSALADAPRVPMPDGIQNVYRYECFNSVTWVVVLGAPMLLYFQRLGASATVLALASGLAPAFSTLQIPAARYVEKIGYRRMVVGGWTARSLFIVGMTVVTFIPGHLAPTANIFLMLLLMAGFTLLRGISLCGILPWFTHIVPESRRGEFLAKDQIASSVAAVASLAFFSWIIGGRERWYSLGMLYAIATVSAFVSVRFLRLVPDVPVEKSNPNPAPLPWRAMFLYPPFQRFMRYTVLVNMVLGASTVFWVRFFRIALHQTDSNILLVGAVTTLAMALALWLVSEIIDRTGSRPALTLSAGLFVVHFGLWCAVAGHLIAGTREIILFQCVVSGLAAALFNLANLRAVMGIVPVLGRAHFLALYSVGVNLSLALVPLLWGPVFDSLGTWQLAWGRWNWNSFTIFYFTLALSMAVALLLLRGVHESGDPMRWNDFTRELLVNTPARAVSRVVGRFRGPGM